MTRHLKRRLGQFFGLMLGLSAPVYVLGAIAPALNRLLPFGLPLGATLTVLPTAVAVWLVQREEGRAGVRRLLGRTLDIQRVPQKRWLLVAALLMPAALTLSYAVQRAMGEELPAANLNWVALPAHFALFFVASILEEFGWMGYAIDPMQQQYGPLAASLLLGGFWAGWHVILYFQMGHVAGWVFWQCLCSVAARVLMVWLYNNAGQSVLTAILFHTMLNISEFSFPHGGSHYDPRVTGLILTACAALVTLRSNPSLGLPPTEPPLLRS